MLGVTSSQHSSTYDMVSDGNQVLKDCFSTTRPTQRPRNGGGGGMGVRGSAHLKQAKLSDYRDTVRRALPTRQIFRLLDRRSLGKEVRSELRCSWYFSTQLAFADCRLVHTLSLVSIILPMKSVNGASGRSQSRKCVQRRHWW